MKTSLYCDITNTIIYPNDVVYIIDYPDVKWIAKHGWYKVGGAQKNGWYFVSIADKTILPVESINLVNVEKDDTYVTPSQNKYPDTPKNEPAVAEVDYLVIPGTNIRLYAQDIVTISNKPGVKYLVQSGWYIYENVQNFGWYLESIKDGTIIPASNIDLTLCTLVTDKIQGSNKYDGKQVNYTRPYTEYDAEILSRTFITLDTVEQRDNLDPNKLIEGKIVRINNDEDGNTNYYEWDSDLKVWDRIDHFTDSIHEIIGTLENPVILTQVEEGLYRVKGVYKITPESDIIETDIDHLTFISAEDDIKIKVVSEDKISDYVVDSEGEIVFLSYATEKYVDDLFDLVEAQIEAIVVEFDDKVTDLIDKRMEERLDTIPSSFIQGLFN